jgi:serine protease AprX
MKPSRVFQFVMIASLLLALGGSPAKEASAAKAQPQLVQMAAAQPEAFVRVIVQKMPGSTGTEARVAALGGQATKDLRIINAFAAEMTAEAAMELARAVDVRWVSLDAPVASSDGPIDTTNLASAFVKAVGADRVWNAGPAYLQGQGVTVAVLDSGNCQNDAPGKQTCADLLGPDMLTRVLATTSYNKGNEAPDYYGHGSLVEGVIGGTGSGSNGKYIGIAPNVNLVSVKISSNSGMAEASDVVAGMQWVLENKSTYHIRVANVSMNSSVAESYHTSPLDAAAEILWFNGIVVVVSAGNNGTASLYPPANDPFVITVGATDDKGTASLTDDVIASFSAYGTTEDGFAKPDLVAPGKNIISIVPKSKNKIWKDHASNRIGEKAANEYYMRVSGTSFSAPVVSGAIALLLQNEPDLTPDQVKYRLSATANQSWPDYSATKAGAGYLDIYAAVNGTTTQSANTNILPSHLLSTGTDPITFGSVGWNSVGWNSVGWNSVGWNSVGWNSVGWNSDYWGP